MPNTSPQIWLFFLFALVAGAALPTQAGLNTQLSRYLGSPLHSSLISFVVGSVGLFVYCLITGVPKPNFAALPAGTLHLWIGGLLGAFYVTATIILAPRLGAAGMISLIVAGQMTASVLLDHYGALGYAAHPASLYRLLGVGLITLGVVFVQKF